MDTIIKITIALFILSIFLLFFKVTKTLSKDYMKGHLNSYKDFSEIMMRDSKKSYNNNLDEYNLPKNFLDDDESLVRNIS
jgi:hypothetical protein